MARGDDTLASDTDFLVTFAPGASLFDLAGLIAALEDLLDGPVDVIPRDCLEPDTRDDHRAMLADEVPLQGARADTPHRLPQIAASLGEAQPPNRRRRALRGG